MRSRPSMETSPPGKHRIPLRARRGPLHGRRLHLHASLAGVLLLAAAWVALFVTADPVFALGENAGIRLLVHVDDQFIPPAGEVTENPCEQP